MWVDISEKYEASSEGHIRNKKTMRMLKEFAGKDGYLRTQFDGKTRTIHRVIASAFIPTEEGKIFVNHIDGNKSNNAASNLEWCTREENIQHAYDHGLMKPHCGTTNGRCKLTYEDVSFILENYIRGDKVFGATPLAKTFGVARQTICAVVSGQNWKTLPSKTTGGDSDV